MNPTNILQQVITYNESNLPYLDNQLVFVSNANMKFKNPQTFPANLGDTIDFDLPTRFSTTQGLVAAFQGVEQRVGRLTVDQSANVAYEFTAEQFIFNVEDYMTRFGMGAMEELSSEIEGTVAELCLKPYRFYGNGITPISSFGQLGEALALFRNYGAAKQDTKFFIDDVAQSAIVNTGLGQFTDRNNEMSMSWEVGTFSRCQFLASNLLPTHQSGTIGDAGTILTVTGTVVVDGAVTAITCSGAGTEPQALVIDDHGQFVDGTPGFANLRYLTFIGHRVSKNPVQFSVTTNSASSGGNVTFGVYPALQVTPGKNQNLNTAILPGMKIKFLPSHRASMIMAGQPLFVGMPRLPDETPFPTSILTSPGNMSLRMYYGSQFGQNKRGTVHDVIWGQTLISEYAMMVVYPI